MVLQFWFGNQICLVMQSPEEFFDASPSFVLLEVAEVSPVPSFTCDCCCSDCCTPFNFGIKWDYKLRDRCIHYKKNIRKVSIKTTNKITN